MHALSDLRGIVNQYMRKQPYINRDEFFECSACGATVVNAWYEYVENGKVSRVYHCGSCGFMFARPVLLDDIRARQMDSIGDAEFFQNAVLKKLHEHLIIRREIQAVARLLQRDVFTMLDVGCGTGWTSSIWKKAGIDVTGLEPSITRGSIAQERYGLRIIPSYIEEVITEEQFDVVVMRHVVEHLADPLPVLNKVRSLLKDDGLLVMIVPNINCIGRYIFGSKWTWVLPWHCNFFNPEALFRLAERAGFTPMKSYQTPSPLWYPQSFLRIFPGTNRLSRRVYKKLSLLAFFPFLPIVALGYLTGFSDNITLIAKMRGDNQ